MDPFDELSRRLWLLREQLEHLVCALDIQQLVLTNHRLRWLPMVTENVEHLVDDIRRSDEERVALSRRVARSLGLADEASLADLASSAAEPHASTWRRHRLQLIALHAEIDELSSANQEIGLRTAASTRDLLASLDGGGVETYDPTGGTQTLTPAAHVFDRSV